MPLSLGEYPKQLADGPWVTVLWRHLDQATVECDTREDADAIMDFGRIMEDYDSGIKNPVNRVRRCLEAMARAGYDARNWYGREILHAFEHAKKNPL